MPHRMHSPRPRPIFLCAALFLSLLVLLASCRSGETRGLLWYQDAMSAATLTEESGLAWRIVLRPDGFSATLTAPDEVAGIVYSVEGTAATIRAGDITIPVSDEMMRGARRAARCLMLTDDRLIGVETAKAGERYAVLAHYESADGAYDVAIDADGCPVWIEARDAAGSQRYAVTLERMPESEISS